MTPNPLDEMTPTPGPQAPADRPTAIGPAPVLTPAPVATPAADSVQAPAPADQPADQTDAPDGPLPALTPILDYLRTVGTGQVNRDRVASVYGRHKTIRPFMAALSKGEDGVPSLTAKKVGDYIDEVLKRRQSRKK